ncbi:hypothetical protein ACFVTC_18040 [Streptomyces sp. NPDC057950]|uniref:hypothetical protein n=1 Tax=Streptomyces sp. NPDC057950 TaxID=3346288 RepID=UPI0036E7DB72
MASARATGCPRNVGEAATARAGHPPQLGYAPDVRCALVTALVTATATVAVAVAVAVAVREIRQARRDRGQAPYGAHRRGPQSVAGVQKPPRLTP